LNHRGFLHHCGSTHIVYLSFWRCWILRLVQETMLSYSFKSFIFISSKFLGSWAVVSFIKQSCKYGFFDLVYINMVHLGTSFLSSRVQGSGQSWGGFGLWSMHGYHGSSLWKGWDINPLSSLFSCCINLGMSFFSFFLFFFFFFLII
jgi:hypothetical protein